MPADFATSISCIDGRIQEPLGAWIRSEFGAKFVDTITEPGPDRRIEDKDIADALRKKAQISIKAHKSENIVFSGHHDCAANPCTAEEHIGMIKNAVGRIDAWGLGVKVSGVWVNENWNIERVV